MFYTRECVIIKIHYNWLPLTADQNENGSLVSSLVSHVLFKMAEDDNLSTDSF